MHGDLHWDLAYLSDRKKPRTITAAANRDGPGLTGRVSGGGAHLLNLSLQYRF